MAKLKLSDTWKPYRGPNQTYRIVSCRFGVKIIEPKHKPHRGPRDRIHPCKNPARWPLIRADQLIFRRFASNWKKGWGVAWDRDLWDWYLEDIDKDAWQTFAANNPYYVTRTQTQILTGYQAFQAWNQAGLSAGFLRLQQGPWAWWYPPMTWPNPPAAYSPILLGSLTVSQVPPTDYIRYDLTPDLPPTWWTILLYLSGPAHTSWDQTEMPPTWISCVENQDGWGPPYWYTDNYAWVTSWSCYGPGMIRPAVRIIDGPTGSPAPLFFPPQNLYVTT